MQAIKEEQKVVQIANEPKLVKRQEKLKQEEEELRELEKKYNQEANQEDDSQNELEESNQEEAHNDAKPEDQKHDWRKRHADARRWGQELEKKAKSLEEKLEELQKENEELRQNRNTPGKVSENDVKEWMKKYPQVASIVESIADKIADTKLTSVKTKFKELEEKEYEMSIKKAENMVLKSHPDFEQIREDDKFHDWVEEQSEWIQKTVYENETDAAGLIRVLDLYKMDTGDSDLGVRVKGARSKPRENTNKKVWSRSEIEGLSLKDYEKYEKDIEEAYREGRIKN